MNVKIFLFVMISFLFVMISFFLVQEEKKITKYQFEQISKHEIAKIEEEHNSERINDSVKISLSKKYYPNPNNYEIPNPISYKRETKDFIPFRVNYFYSKHDKIVRLISYTWSKNAFSSNVFELLTATKDEYKYIDRYHTHYENVLSELKSQLGKPHEGSGEIEEVNSENGKSLRRRAKWINDNRIVVLNMNFTPKEWKGSIGTYRVRLRIYWL